jgi:hypothetical protein
MLKIHNETERIIARETLIEVTRKLEEALKLSRELEARKHEKELCHK